MKHDEHEMMVEYAEMTAFNFNSKEYQEARKDFIECQKTAHNLEWFFKNLISRFRKAEIV